MTSSFGCDVPADVPKDAEKSELPRSTLVSRNVTIAGHRTSVRLEPEMWSGLGEICRRERMIMHEVCTSIAMRKLKNTSLTAAIRVFVMAYFRAATTEDGHNKAGHGYGGAIGTSPTPRAAASTGMPVFAISANKMDGTRRF